MVTEGDCLVERCMPGESKDADKLTDKMKSLIINISPPTKIKTTHSNAKKIDGSQRTCRDNANLKEHFHTQSIRSAIKAGKTKTTATVENREQRLQELLNKDPKARFEQTHNIDKENENDEENDGDLLDRGPVRNNSKYVQSSHPYGERPERLDAYAMPPHQDLMTPYYYQAETTTGGWENAEGGQGYLVPKLEQSTDTSRAPCRESGTTNLDRIHLDRIYQPHRKELPEALSDFILKYSRRYSRDSTSTLSSQRMDGSPASLSGAETPDHFDSNDDTSSSACNSPMSAGTPPISSPAAPNASTTCNKAKQSDDAENRLKAILPKSNTRMSSAKEKLKRMFTDTQMLEAWAWAVKCVQMCPGAMYFRDPDGDSLLHIVVWHRDLAKTYALVEHMIKGDYSASCHKPFDLPNRNNETPLFLAVEKRMEEVVAYLVECGANPNIITRRSDAESPLHYASSRGMVEIVNALIAHPNTNKNLVNALGLTALMCAVKNHGVIEEESQCLVNNKPTIRALLKAGADPKIADATNGKTVLHYSVERMDPELVEIFRVNVDKMEMKQLVNAASYELESALQLVQRLALEQRGDRPEVQDHLRSNRPEAEDHLRSKMISCLLDCGASMSHTDENGLY